MTEVYIPVALREAVIKRARGCCEYCWSPSRYSPEVFEVEHIRPISAGGTTTLDNLALACPACNRHKGSHQSGIDPQTGRHVPLYNPRRQQWSDHFRWSDDLTEIVGQTPTGRATVHVLHMNRPSVRRFRAALRALDLHPGRENNASTSDRM
jgi:hypothetical protein